MYTYTQPNSRNHAKISTFIWDSKTYIHTYIHAYMHTYTQPNSRNHAKISNFIWDSERQWKKIRAKAKGEDKSASKKDKQDL
jgi:hypothetical protein